jgi:predicted MFS family arabinose efflux permease
VVAAAESGCSPTAYSLIADSFSVRFRGRAISLYALGVPIGAWAGLTLGGIVNDHVGWRATFLFIGAPGLLLALITLLWMRDPPRGGHDGVVSRSRTFTVLEALGFMRRSRAFVLSCVSIGLLAITTSSFQGWAPTYLIRSQGFSSGTVGLLSGTLSGIGGIIAALLAGFLADHLGRRDPRWYLWLPMTGAAILLPAEQLFLRVHGPLSFVFYFLTVLAGGTYVAPLFTVCQVLLPPRVRAFGSAVMLLVINLVGMGGGIFAAGALSDLFHSHGFAEPLAMALQFLQLGAGLGLFTLAWAALWVKRDAAALK